MRTLTLLLSIVAMVLAMALPALAAHEANNKFDMADVDGGTADATGISNYSAGNEGWNNHIRATGLTPDTVYRWVGIAEGTAHEICSFATDADGDGTCRSDVNSSLGATEVRQGDEPTPVLRADALDDDDNRVEDGEIERRGTQRDA